MDLDDLVKGLLEDLHRIAKSDAVTGVVREAGDAHVLPLSRITIGFGSASTGAKGEAHRERVDGDAGAEGGGIMGAVAVQPKAFVVVDGKGAPHMLVLNGGKQAVVRRGLELAALAADKLISGDAEESNEKLGSGR